MRISLELLVLVCSALQANCICNFPCEWIGKTFEYVIPNNSMGSLIFDAVNKSTATLEVIFTTQEGGFTVDLVCEQIRGSNLLLSWNQHDRRPDKACLTANIINPDVFAFIGRNLLVKPASICEVCFKANSLNSIQLVARANGATGGEQLDCVGDTPCIEKGDKACKIRPLQPCPGNKFAAQSKKN